jgi:hypothetical protein
MKRFFAGGHIKPADKPWRPAAPDNQPGEETSAGTGSGATAPCLHESALVGREVFDAAGGMWADCGTCPICFSTIHRKDEAA